MISLPSKHISIILSHGFIITKSQNMGYCWSAPKCKMRKKVQKKCKMNVIGYIILLYNGIIIVGLKYGCILPCCPFGFVLW